MPDLTTDESREFPRRIEVEAEAGESLHSDTTAALFPLFLSVGISLPQPPLSTEEEEEEEEGEGSIKIGGGEK